MPTVLLSIGSNLGDRKAALQSVIDAMATAFTGIEPSRIFETPPWGYTDQPVFYNAAIRATTTLTPQQVLDFAHTCESNAQRQRDEHWGPRTLDVDVITYDDLIQDDPTLTLPHPRTHERAFVLVPIADIDPLIEIPGKGNVLRLLHHVDITGIQPVGELELP